MDQKYQALFTPWKIGNVEIKNRIVMCPMGGTSLFGWFELTGCKFDKEAAKLFLERAQNNVGLIIPGIAPLRDTFWGKWLWQNTKMFEELKEFMDEIHKTGAKLFVQLTAGMGRSWAITELVAPLHKNKFTRAIVKPIIDTSHELASPSAQPSRWAEDIICPEMTVEQIHEIIEAFAKTAKLCKEAGVKTVIAKCSDEMQRKILLKVGADQVMFPESESGTRLARNLISSGFMDIIDLSDDVSMVELAVRPEWAGQNLLQLNLRRKYGINVVAVCRGENVDINIDPERPLQADTKLIVIAHTSELNKLK